MTHPTSIILEPKLMFDTLDKLEKETRGIVVSMYMLGYRLEQVSTLTYAQGFGELIKKAEKDINHLGNALIAANNSFNTACAEVINHLVEKFAPQGAKSTYNVPPFREVHIKVNTADRAAIYPTDMKALFDQYKEKIKVFSLYYINIQDAYIETKKFWIGSSAERTRHTFHTKINPLYEDLFRALLRIENHGLEWIDEAVKFEANLNVP
jgi:hypothetical protein